MTKTQDLKLELKNVPLNSPRHDEIISELERIKEWCEKQPWYQGGGNYSNSIKKYPQAGKKQFCIPCKRETYVIPPRPHQCSGCGENY